MSRCIWCLRSDRKPSIEHIIPEVMGCPADFVLSNGEVCEPCNNGKLGRLDRALAHEFDFVLHHFQIPGKKGKAPSVRTRGNVVATSDPRVYSINMDRVPREAHDGTRLGAYGKSERNIDAAMRRSGDMAEVAFDVTFGGHKDFVRALVKIAYETVAFYLGPETAIAGQHQHIRNYVIGRRGKRRVIVRGSSDSHFKNQVWPPYIKEGEYTVCIRLAMCEFLVDLSQGQKNLEVLVDEQRRKMPKGGWTLIPPDA